MRPSSVSQPVSPIYKKPQRTIGKKELQDTPTAPLHSPARALRKHIYAATFATHNPRKDAKEDACPVHSYSSVDAIEKILPNKHAAHGVRWGDTKRDASLRPNCPVHSYDSEPKSARPVGPATFPKHDERATGEATACPVHAYGEAKSSLRERTATFAKFATPRVTARGSGPSVHAYLEPTSSLASRGASVFGAEKYGKAAKVDMCPVHAYSSLSSSLRTSGAVSFGGTAPRACLLTGLTRTGLIPANATPRARVQLKPLPTPQKLGVVAEASIEAPVALVTAEA